MTEANLPAGTTNRLTGINGWLARQAAIGGLLGGLVLFAVMAIYNAAKGMGFWSIINACFASFVYKNAGMTSMGGEKAMPGEPMMGHQMMTSGPIVASHLTTGSVLHLLMSATAGVAFAVVLAVLLRLGLRVLTNPLVYVAAAAAGGALLYVIMMYIVAPAMNSEIVDFTPRVPFFISHLLFGATAAGFVYWQAARVAHGAGRPAHQFRLGHA
jgi:hypothetical protein